MRNHFSFQLTQTLVFLLTVSCKCLQRPSFFRTRTTLRLLESPHLNQLQANENIKIIFPGNGWNQPTPPPSPPTSQSCQCYPLVPLAKFIDLGGFLNYTAILGLPHEVIALNLPQLFCLLEAANIKLLHVLLKTEVTPKRLPQLAIIWLLQRDPKEKFLPLLAIILLWFLNRHDWFLKHA